MTETKNQKNSADDVLTTSEALRTLSAEIDQALQKGQAGQFRTLIKQHSRLVHQLLGPANSPQLAPETLAKTAEKYKEWIKRAQQLLKDTQDKIDNLQPLKNARRQVSSAYSGRPLKAGHLISRKG